MNWYKDSTLKKLILGGVFLFSLLSMQVQAAELRPYTPPIQQQAPSMEQRRPSYQQSLPAQKAIEPAGQLDSYYRSFESNTSKLTKEQRDKLIEAFSEQLDAAVKSKQWEKVAHYLKLIEILRGR
jgi:hypothetical protein